MKFAIVDPGSHPPPIPSMDPKPAKAGKHAGHDRPATMIDPMDAPPAILVFINKISRDRIGSLQRIPHLP